MSADRPALESPPTRVYRGHRPETRWLVGSLVESELVVSREADSLLRALPEAAPDVEVVSELGVLDPRGPRLRVELRDRRDGSTVVVIVEGDYSSRVAAWARIPGTNDEEPGTPAVLSWLREGHLPSRVVARVVPNADYLRVVEAVEATPRPVLRRALEAALAGGRPLRALASVLDLEEVAPRALAGALPVLADLAAGAPLEWALRRYLGEGR